MLSRACLFVHVRSHSVYTRVLIQRCAKFLSHVVHVHAYTYVRVRVGVRRVRGAWVAFQSNSMITHAQTCSFIFVSRRWGWGIKSAVCTEYKVDIMIIRRVSNV